MIVTTLDHAAGLQIGDTLGLIRGVSTWTRRVSKSYAGGIRGVEVHGMAELDSGLTETRLRATDAAKQEAAAMGANAIVGIRTEVKELTPGVFMVCVTGTAVKTYRLPANVPAYRSEDDVPPVAPMLHAQALQRASYEGSTLRH